jgi:hypothetical protein
VRGDGPVTAPAPPQARGDAPAISPTLPQRQRTDSFKFVPEPVMFDTVRPTPEQARIQVSWAFLVAELTVALAAVGLVLWLLLVRRNLLAARLTFLGFFVTATLFLVTVEIRPATIDNFTLVPVPAPTEAQRLAAFTSNDRNGDSRLDKTEYSALLDQLGFSGQLESLWAQRDDNRDGFVSFEEYKDPIQ